MRAGDVTNQWWGVADEVNHGVVDSEVEEQRIHSKKDSADSLDSASPGLSRCRRCTTGAPSHVGAREAVCPSSGAGPQSL